VKAYVLITAATGRIGEVQERLRALGIAEVDAVSGAYDLVAVLEASDPLEIGRTVLNGIQGADGVLDTVTLLQLG
jgi:uncharacterized protein with GYD domain